MKVVVFGMRKEEEEIFRKWADVYGYGLCMRSDFLSENNVNEINGYEAVCIVVNCRITRKMAQLMAEAGVKYILTRAAGTDHLDVEAIHEYGMQTANVPFYSPNAVAEHTILLTLASLRHLKEQVNRTSEYNFTITGLQGRELRNMTVGVIGTGRIGCTTIRYLSGFGCRILAYDQREQEEVSQYVTYVTLDEILTGSDILILHCPLTEENYHMINTQVIEKCRNGVILINCARGGLIDCEAVLEALQEGKVSALAMDVYEKEDTFLRKDKSEEGLRDEVLEKLISREDVIYTAHTAFYTDEAISNMVETSFKNLFEYEKTGVCKNEVIG